VGALPADRVVRDGPPALLDVGRVRALRVPTVGVLHRDGAAVVLGSMQRVEDLEPAALARDGVAVLRRRGGGGAVLLGPDDCWVELWLPCPHHGEDLRATACTVGEWWEVALAALGVAGAVHRGGRSRASPASAPARSPSRVASSSGSRSGGAARAPWSRR